MAFEKDEMVQLSEELLDDYQNSYRAEWIQEAIDDDAFRSNVQWSEADAKTLEERNQFPIVINYVHRGVELAKALLTSRQPRFSATAREDSDVRTASLMSDLMAYIWYNSKGNRELKRVIDDYYVRGMGAMLVWHDPLADGGKGEVFLKSIDPFNLYVSPDTQDSYALDTPHILYLQTFTAAQFTWAYPDFAWALEDAQMTSYNRHPSTQYHASESQVVGVTMDTSKDYYELIDRYSRVKVPLINLMDHATHTEKHLENEQELKQELQRPCYIQMSRAALEPVYITKPEAVLAMSRMESQLGSVFHYTTGPDGQPVPAPGEEAGDPSAIPDSETVLQKVTVADLLQMGIFEVITTYQDRIQRVMSIGGILLDSRILPCSTYPIITLMNHHTRNPYPGSDVRKVRPIQSAINKIESLIMAHMANSTNLKVFVPEGAIDEQQLKERWNKAGAQYFTYDGSMGDVTIAGPVPLAQEAFMLKDKLKMDIEDILGVYAMMQGDAAGSPDTFRGTMMLEEYGQRRMRTKQDDIEEFLNQVGRVVVEFVQRTYTSHKIFRLVEPFPTDPRAAEINIPIYNEYTNEEIGKTLDITAGKYDLIVVSGSMMPTNRWAKMELYMQMYEKGIIDAVEVLKQTDVVDMVGVLQRQNIMMQQQQMIAQLQEELKKTKGDLQTATRESVQDRKRVEVEKFKTRLNAQSAKVEGAAELYKARLGDELRNLERNGEGPQSETEETGIGEGVVEA